MRAIADIGRLSDSARSSICLRMAGGIFTPISSITASGMGAKLYPVNFVVKNYFQARLCKSRYWGNAGGNYFVEMAVAGAVRTAPAVELSAFG